MSFVLHHRLDILKKWHLLACVALCCIGIFSSYDAYAAGICSAVGLPPDPSQPTGPGNEINNQITQTFVNCVDQAIRADTLVLLQLLSDHMTPVVSAIFVFAIIMHGIRILGGEGDVTSKTASFLIRLGAVSFFCYDLGGFAQSAYDIMDELSGVVSGGGTPWAQVDTFVGQLLGFDATNNGNKELNHGVLALVSASVFSGAPGIMMFSAGVIAILEMIMFVFEIVYVYLLAVLLLSMIIIVSPFIIPLALFQYSDKFFKQWLSAMMGAIMIPAFLFGFLFMTLGFFQDQIMNPQHGILALLDPNSNIDANGNHIYSTYMRQNQSFFSWLMPVDPNFNKMIGQTINNANPNVPVSQMPATTSNMNSGSKTSASVDFFKYWGINFGHGNNAQSGNPYSNASQIKSLMLAFVNLWIYASVFMGLVKKMPETAQIIAQSAAAIGVQNQSISSKVAETVQDLKMGGGALLGGFAGGNLAAGLTKSAKGRETSAVVGAIVGGLIGKRI